MLDGVVKISERTSLTCHCAFRVSVDVFCAIHHCSLGISPVTSDSGVKTLSDWLLCDQVICNVVHVHVDVVLYIFKAKAWCWLGSCVETLKTLNLHDSCAS